MSVLVEALTLVVPRFALDIGYPGGTDGFIESVSEPAIAKRFVCADEHLVSVSFLTTESLLPVANRLIESGLIETNDDSFCEFALVDQEFGPTLPCNWLVWQKHDAGYTTAWIATSEQGDLAAPENWTPEQSRQLARTDVRDEPGWGLKLAEENGLETWLDFQSGRINTSLAHRALTPTTLEQKILDAARRAEMDREAKLMNVVRETLDGLGWKYDMLEGNKSLTLRLIGAHGSQDFLLFVDDAVEVIVCYLTSGFRVPEPMRTPVCELLTRANYGLRIGNFEMDMGDGEVRYKTSIDIEGGTLTPKMAMSLISISGTCYDTYYPALMKVTYGTASPADAIREAEAA